MQLKRENLFEMVNLSYHFDTNVGLPGYIDVGGGCWRQFCVGDKFERLVSYQPMVTDFYIEKVTNKIILSSTSYNGHNH